MLKPRVFTQEEIAELPEQWQRVLERPSFMRMDEVGIDYRTAIQRIKELQQQHGMKHEGALSQVILEAYYAHTDDET